MATQPPTAADIEQAIRRYLEEHPHALDTERGIREWWLRYIHPRCPAADVHAAIERMVAAGEIVERALPDGQRGYASPKSTQPRPQGRS